ncbi:hypothetical protein EBZ39_13280 [bacterium]|jgi:hypothetical protein|nr:hypothetical protein [bacterium]
MEKIKAIIDSIGFNNTILLVSGMLGALSYALKKEMRLWQKVSVVIMGGASSLFVTPLLVYWLGLPNTAQISGGIGYLIGLFSIEVMETAFKLFDEMQKNPKFLIEFIMKKFKR